MEDNKHKSTNGQNSQFGDDTIVFRRQPSVKSTPATDMQNTAKLQGGAVIRPLKSQSSVPPTESVHNVSEQKKLTPMQEAQRRQQLLREQQATNKPMPQSTTKPTVPNAPKSTVSSSQNRQQNVPAQPQNNISRPSDRPPMVTQTHVRAEQKNVSPTSIRPLQPSQPRQSAQNLQQNRIASPATPQNASIQNVGQRTGQPIQQQNMPAQRPSVNNVGSPRNVSGNAVGTGKHTASSNRNIPSQNMPAVAPQTSKRTEDDDFEIDEVTWSRKSSKHFQKDSSAVDSATSAIMSLVKAMVYIVVIIAVAVGLSVFIINTGNDIFKFVVNEKMVTVTIPEDATIEDVSDALYDAGAIKYKWAFNFWSNLKDENAEFIPGTYEVSTSLNYDYLRASFKESKSRAEVRITIPEGYTVDDIIDLFVKNGIGTREGFVDAIQNYDFEYRFLEGLEVSPDRIYRLEGYLFPDTYNFYQDSSEVTVIKKLLDNFNRKFVDEYYNRCIDLKMTVDEAIILASMVEKETRYADELGYVSSVFHNRLKYSASFPFLNSDATIMYAMQHDLGGRPDSMAGEDTEYVTPYNTYTNKGLPPGPIANPGLNSIKYALYPNQSNYFYFVSDSSGRMLFATTEPEHIKNINIARGN